MRAEGTEGRRTQGREARLQVWNRRHLDRVMGRTWEESHRAACDERARLEALVDLAERWGADLLCERK